MAKLNLKGLGGGVQPRDNEEEIIKIEKLVDEPQMVIAQPIPAKKPTFALDLSKAQKHEENR